MLNVNLYTRTEQPFASYQHLPQSQRQAWVIVANPAKSDLAREHLIKLGIADSIQSLTISKFIENFLQAVKRSVELSQKAEVVQGLCFSWMKSYGEKDFNRFLTAYNIFSELRGFSTDLNLLDEVLDFFDQDLAQGVRALWKFYDSWGIFLDEHQAYQLMGELLSSEERDEILSALPPKLIFWGFEHMSGTQVDLLKSLALHFEVDVLYSHELFQVKKSTDWISWLSPVQKQSTVMIPSEVLPEITVYTYPRLRLAEVDFDLSAKSVVFACKELNAQMLLQLPSGTQHFSYNINPFDHYINQLRDELLSMEGKHVDEVLLFLDKNLDKLKKNKLFKEIKILTLYKDFFATITWPSYHSKHLSIFLIELAHFVVGLKKPRVNLLPLNQELAQKKIFDAASYLDLSDEPVFMVALAEHSALRGSPALISQEAEQKLMALGPIFNKSLFYQAFKLKLQKDLAQAKVQLFLEDGVHEKDSSWEEILSDFSSVHYVSLAKKKASLVRSSEATNFHQSDFENKLPLPLSYSALQAFYDCPRKFALQFLEKRTPMVQLDHALGSSHLGELEHAVIETYFKDALSPIYVAAKHETIVQQLMKEFLAKRVIELNAEDYAQAYYEILSLSESGILFLLELTKAPSFESIRFEQSFQTSTLRGRVDALVKFEWGSLVVDFKRSGSSVPNLGEISRHEKIQMPVYLSHMNEKILGFAYINLSEIADSIILLDNVALEALSVLAWEPKLREFKLAPWLEEYQVLEKNILKEYQEEALFKPKPRDLEVCHFCLLSNVCSRSYV